MLGLGFLGGTGEESTVSRCSYFLGSTSAGNTRCLWKGGYFMILLFGPSVPVPEVLVHLLSFKELFRKQVWPIFTFFNSQTTMSQPRLWPHQVLCATPHNLFRRMGPSKWYQVMLSFSCTGLSHSSSLCLLTHVFQHFEISILIKFSLEVQKKYVPNLIQPSSTALWWWEWLMKSTVVPDTKSKELHFLNRSYRSAIVYPIVLLSVPQTYLPLCYNHKDWQRTLPNFR